MNDERIEKKLSIIKRNLHFLWFILPILSVVYKVLVGENLYSIELILPELVFFFGSLVALIAGFIQLSAEVIDERIIRKNYLLYQRSFLITSISTGIAYLIQVVLSPVTISLSRVPTNFFVNLVISLSFLVYYISARIQGIYLNFKSVENDKRSYFKQIGKTILKMGGVSILFGILGISLKYIFQGSQSILVIEGACLASFLIIAIEYLLLSILEKNHFDEALSHEQGKTILLSKNVRFLMIIEMPISLSFSLFSFLVTYIAFNHVQLPTELSRVFNALSQVGEPYQLRLIFLGYIAAVFAFISLKRSLPRDHQKLNMLFILYTILTIVNVICDLFMLLINFFPLPNGENTTVILVSAAKITSVFSLLGILPIFLCFLLFQKHRYGFAWLIFSKILLSIVWMLLMRVLIDITPFSVLYFIFACGMSLAQMILSILILFRMTGIYISKEPRSENEAVS